MPVEVRELVIKATVSEDDRAAQGAEPADTQVLQGEEIIKACIHKILEILKEKNGR